MMTGRRARRRPLIRSEAMEKTLPAMDSMTGRSQDQGDNGLAAVLKAYPSEEGYLTPLSLHAASLPQPGLTRYLQQLSALHAVGVLTDNEFSAAKRRLFGS